LAGFASAKIMEFHKKHKKNREKKVYFLVNLEKVPIFAAQLCEIIK